MKLLRCHVENFGRLSDADFSFDPVFHEENHQNGWGKSTLAAFIQAMFYGLEKRRSSGSGREMYEPWQKGTFGGTLTFENKEGTFRIERTFGKTAKSDTFALYDDRTGLVSRQYSENIGEELFALNKDSFRSTAFIAQQESKSREASPQISAKLGGLDDTLADMGSYDKAMEILDKERKKRKGTARDYPITKVRNELRLQEQIIQNEDAVKDEIRQIEERSREEKIKDGKFEREAGLLEKEIKKISRRKDLAGKRKVWESLKASSEESQRALKKETGFFPERVPAVDEVEKYQKMAAGYEGIGTARDRYRLSRSEWEELGKLKREFRLGVPEDDELSDIDMLITQFNEIRAKRDAERLSNEERERFFAAADFFSGGFPREEEIEAVRKLHRENEESEKKLPYMKDTLKSRTDHYEQLEREHQNRMKQKKLFPVLCAGGILLLIIGILLAVAVKQAAAGIALAVIGGAVSGISLYAGSRKKREEGEVSSDTEEEKETREAELRNLQEEIRETEEKIHRRREDIEGFFRKYSLYPEGKDLETFLQEISRKLADYLQLMKKENAFRHKDYDSELSRLGERINHFLRRYADPDRESDHHKLIRRLERDRGRLLQLEEKKANSESDDIDQEKMQKDVDRFITSLGFLIKENDREGQLSEIFGHVKTLKILEEDAEKKNADLEKFEKENKKELSALQAEEDTGGGDDLNAMNARYQEVHEQRAACSANIAMCRSSMEEALREMDKIRGAQERKSVLEEEKNRLSGECHIIEKTEEYLEKSRDAFVAEYTDPIMKGFRKYYKILTGEEPENYTMDAHLNLQYKAYGQHRKTETLSEGYQDLVGLCRSMALVDAMFTEEKPFVLFDDPFVNYDDNKVAGGLAFLKEVSKEYQVIYFTCHDSRTV